MLQLPRRLQSIDVFRAVTMFFMIFVNDVDGVEKIPEWIKHVSGDADGLGFADIVFPAFLFIVGLSIPFALTKRMQSGEGKAKIAWHIALRSLALIVMGFFHVNLEYYSDTALLPHAVFEIIATLAFFLIWLDYKPSVRKTLQNVLQAIGVIILIVLAFLYKGESGGQVIGLRTHWWGILGLIGWAYLTCALLYLFTGGKLTTQIIILFLFLAYNIVRSAGMLDFLSPVLKYCWFIGNGSEASLILSGVIISLVYKNNINKQNKNFLPVIFVIALIMLGFGFITRPIGGISKIHATPAWTAICAGISILVFAILVFIVDVKGKPRWFNAVKPAGTSTLTCYLIPYFLYSFMVLFNFKYPEFLGEGVGGLLRSLAVAFVVILITGFLEKRNLRLKI